MFAWDSHEQFRSHKYDYTIGIRVVPSSGTRGFADGINSAILHYDGAVDADPTSIQTSGTLLDEADLAVSPSLLPLYD